MPVVNVHFKGVPPDKVEFIGVFDEDDNQIPGGTWFEIEEGTWAFSLDVPDSDDFTMDLWDESSLTKFVRLWNEQAPGYSFLAKIMNVLGGVFKR